MRVIINIFPKPDVLDPETEAIKNSLEILGFKNLNQFTLGKKITYNVEDKSKKSVYNNAEDMCEKLLVNCVIEDYEITIKEEVQFMRTGVLVFPGSNCDRDVIVALKISSKLNTIEFYKFFLLNLKKGNRYGQFC